MSEGSLEGWIGGGLVHRAQMEHADAVRWRPGLRFNLRVLRVRVKSQDSRQFARAASAVSASANVQCLVWTLGTDQTVYA